MEGPTAPDDEVAELLALVRRLAWADTGELRCEEPGHPDGHVCLPAPAGEGAFDDHLRLYVPGSDARGFDLVGNALRSGAWAREHGAGPWEPYGVHPAPGGLLQWGGTERADAFHWLTEGDDPERWPVVVHAGDTASWARFDGTVTAFLHAVLTDRHHPFSPARHIDGHWFTSYGEPGLTG
ncbi:hypothetical protein [Streptomyces hydrogenans]|uniref:hypothetical protein n=1 Tax=Streptomyces hydrogenans TaxID=1873719 RepID=UPI0033267C72